MRRSGGRRAASVLAAVVLLGVVMLFGSVAVAEAGVITYWNSIQPVGLVGTNIPVTIRGTCAYDPYPFVSSSAKLYIDDVLVPRTSYAASIMRSSVYFYYNPVPKLVDGAHTFRVEVTDTAGRLSTHVWGAYVVQPPTASWVAPAAGSVLHTGRPSIAMDLADNTPGTTFDVVGEVHSGSASGPVVATFGGSDLPAGRSSFTPSVELPEGTYYLTALVSDAEGNAVSLTGAKARGFTTAVVPGMTVLESCDGCHSEYESAHPTPATIDCAVCHPGYDGDHMEGTEYCEDCHYDGWHADGEGQVVAVTSACASCHSASRPDVPIHTEATVADQHQGSCGSCHNTSIILQHAGAPAGSAYANQCDLCHASVDTRVQDAVAAEDTSCDACHTVDPNHGFDLATHEAAEGPPETGTWPYLDAATSFQGTLLNEPYAYSSACTDCHTLALADEHDKSTSTSTGQGCETCHPSPRNTFGAWDKTCTQGGCHTVAGTAKHENLTAEHAMGQADIDAGCGFVNSVNGRRPCHYPDIVQEHNRTISESVDMMTGLSINTTRSVTCAECHSSQAFAELGGAWDGTCGACHDGTQLANHTVAGTARYDEVYAEHNNPAGFYDDGAGKSGTNVMDAHGPVRENPDPNAANKTLGCGVPTCHTQAFLGGGWPYPSIACSSCHGPSVAVVEPYEGSYAWYSDSWYDYQSLDSKLTMTLDPITLPAGSVLQFKTWYDIEEDWDYGYVEVSTDGGTNWVAVPGNITTNTNPYLQNTGNGITGSSGAWVDAYFDLSAYAGQTATIRFSYQADFFTYGLGWMLDVITVGPPGSPVFSDNAETERPEWSVQTYVAYEEWDETLEDYVLVTVPTTETGWKRYTRNP